MDALMAIRAIHYASTLFAAGALAFDWLLAHADRPRHRRWVIAGVTLALLSALAWLWAETAQMSGGTFEDAVSPDLLGSVLSATEFGRAWALRLILLALWLVIVWRVRSRAMLIAGALLGIASAASLAFSGHAAAEGTLGLGADMVHLSLAALWLGSLLPMAALLRDALRQDTGTALAQAARAARRFTPLGLLCVGGLLLTGSFRAWTLVGSIPGLIGTPYGQLLSVKLALFLTMTMFAAVNQQRLTPALATADGARAARRLARNAGIEAALGLLILCDVGIFGIGVPAAHDQPVWPFPITWTMTSMFGDPGKEAMIGGGAVLAAAGFVALALGFLRGRWRWYALGILAVALGLYAAGDALSVEAQPTMYQSSPLSFDVATISAGAGIYNVNCTQCHGRYGYGDGPNADQLVVKPVDLARVHVAHHSDGSLFWWVRYGKGEGAMPAFSNVLDEEQSWQLIAYLRALSFSVAAKTLGPTIDEGRRVPAPGFGFDIDHEGERSLAELRDKQAVLLVLYSLPDSRPRLDRLSAAAPALRSAGLTVVAVPLDEAPDNGAIFASANPELVETYTLFRRDSADALPQIEHSEFLIDRWGYLRARFLNGSTATPDQLRAMVAAMAREPEPPPAGEMQHRH